MMNHYRRDIDGLRCIAVLSVVIFHVQPALLPGGFFGVDIFFVISGFLITGLIIRDIENGGFSYARFYERRIRRLFPAFAAMVVAVFSVGALTMLPMEFADLGKSILWASLGVSNLYFRRDVDYFAESLESSPLLHTWSLGIEEQFYLIFPTIMMIGLWRGRWIAALLFIMIGVVSFAYAQSQHPIVSERAFFSLFCRAWELLLGGGLALWIRSRPHPKRHSSLYDNIFFSIGLATLIFTLSAPGYATISHLGHPGFGTLPATLGAACLLATGGHSRLSGALIANQPMVFIGAISYSLYLWHQPALSFVLLLAPDASLATLWMAAAASGVIAIASWRWIERPFRRHQGNIPQARVFLVFALCSTTLILVGAVALNSDNWHGRVPESVMTAYQDMSTAYDSSAVECNARTEKADDKKRGVASACVDNAESEGGTIYVVGDSHAILIGQQLGRTMKSNPVVRLTQSSCNPAMSVELDGKTSCAAFNVAARARIASDPTAIAVVLAGRWAHALHFEKAYLKGARQATVRLPSSEEVPRNQFVLNLYRQMIAEYRTMGVRVIIVQPWAEFVEHPARRLARAQWLGTMAYAERRAKSDIDTRLGEVYSTFAETNGEPGISLVPTLDLMCDAQICSPVSKAGALLYFDDDHINSDSAALIADRIAREILSLNKFTITPASQPSTR